MARYSSSDHHLVKAVEWKPAAPAERINDFIWMSKGTSNGYLLTSDAGDVVINTGTPDQGPRFRERFEQALGRKLKVDTIVLTQDHFDHIGGWHVFADPGAKTIVQQNYPNLLKERNMLAPFFGPRGRRVLHAITPSTPPYPVPTPKIPDPARLTTFEHLHVFEVGGRKYEVHWASAGETLDSVMVWMPNEKIVFTGNWMGALYGALPHFYTLRGDRDRSVPQFLRELQRLIDWAPEMLITGHDEPIVGAERVRADMTRLHQAISYLHDETLKGMNGGKSLNAMIQDIRLPANLQMAPGRGPEWWYVRAIYEEYTGWFRHESTTELYGVPANSIWHELAHMAGGPDQLAAKARHRVESGEPLQALHFVEIALAADPKHRATREAEIAALELLIERTGGRTFDELGWLESKIAEAKAAMG